MVQLHARVFRARQQGSAGENLQGRAREGPSGPKPTTGPTHAKCQCCMMRVYQRTTGHRPRQGHLLVPWSVDGQGNRESSRSTTNPAHHSTLSVHSQLHVLRPIANKALPSPMRCSPNRSSKATLVTMKGYPLTRPLSGTESNNDLCGVKSQTSLTVFFFASQQKHTHKFWWVFPCSIAFSQLLHLDPSLDDTDRPSKPELVVHLKAIFF